MTVSWVKSSIFFVFDLLEMNAEIVDMWSRHVTLLRNNSFHCIWDENHGILFSTMTETLN